MSTLSSKLVATPFKPAQRAVLKSFIATQRPSSAKLAAFAASIGPKSGRAVTVAAQANHTAAKFHKIG